MSPRQPIKLSNLDKSRMKHGGLLNKHICEKKIQIPVSPVRQQKLSISTFPIINSPEPKAQGELIVYQSSRRLSVCLWTFSNSNISATRGPILTKFYQNHHWGGGKAALGFGPDRIGTLVSMATDSTHRVIMGKML